MVSLRADRELDSILAKTTPDDRSPPPKVSEAAAAATPRRSFQASAGHGAAATS